ncbi:MAG: hypothetical protein HYU29_03470 [Chloroflexi bacterium]|nr:hypothetical protein [Chloroflexota bacterium]
MPKKSRRSSGRPPLRRRLPPTGAPVPSSIEGAREGASRASAGAPSGVPAQAEAARPVARALAPTPRSALSARALGADTGRELKRIGLITGLIFVILIVLSFVLR